jgi:hypothetical protein
MICSIVPNSLLDRNQSVRAADDFQAAASSQHEPTGRANARPMTGSAICGKHSKCEDPGFRFAHPDFACLNPIKHELVPRVSDWPYSSFARMAQDGAYPQDWARDNRDDTRNFGER